MARRRTARARGCGRLRGASSRLVPLHPLLRDDDALHLVRALANAGEGRVAVEPFDIVLLRVAIGAVNAHRLGRVLEGGLRGEVFRHACLEIAALAAVKAAGCIKRQKPRGAGAGHHLAELKLDRLVLADRLAEGLSDLGVFRCETEGAFRNADAARCDVDASELETAGRLIEALALLADQVVPGEPVILEHELGRIDALVAELLEPLADAETRPLRGDEEADALVARLGLGVGFHQEREARAFYAVRDPGLSAVDDVV